MARSSAWSGGGVVGGPPHEVGRGRPPTGGPTRAVLSALATTTFRSEFSVSGSSSIATNGVVCPTVNAIGLMMLIVTAPASLPAGRSIVTVQSPACGSRIVRAPELRGGWAAAGRHPINTAHTATRRCRFERVRIIQSSHPRASSLGRDDVGSLLADHVHGAHDEKSGNPRKHRGVDDAQTLGAMHLEIAGQHSSLLAGANAAG